MSVRIPGYFAPDRFGDVHPVGDLDELARYPDPERRHHGTVFLGDLQYAPSVLGAYGKDVVQRLQHRPDAEIPGSWVHTCSSRSGNFSCMLGCST